jgi:hypothetical protein
LELRCLIHFSRKVEPTTGTLRKRKTVCCTEVWSIIHIPWLRQEGGQVDVEGEGDGDREGEGEE